MKTLEDLLRMKVQSEDKDGNPVDVSPEFRVSVQQVGIGNEGVHFIIHPLDHNGDTLDFVVVGNHLEG